jgi:hypothetical protein
MMMEKTHHVLGQIKLFMITSCKKNCSKIHSYEKTKVGKKHIILF